MAISMGIAMGIATLATLMQNTSVEGYAACVRTRTGSTSSEVRRYTAHKPHTNPSPSNSRPNPSMKNYYTRPSRAIEQGGGFFVPGLEGEKMVIFVGAALLAFLAANNAGPIATQSTNQLVSEAAAFCASAVLLLQGIVTALTKDTISTKQGKELVSRPLRGTFVSATAVEFVKEVLEGTTSVSACAFHAPSRAAYAWFNCDAVAEADIESLQTEHTESSTEVLDAKQLQSKCPSLYALFPQQIKSFVYVTVSAPMSVVAVFGFDAVNSGDVRYISALATAARASELDNSRPKQ